MKKDPLQPFTMKMNRSLRKKLEAEAEEDYKNGGIGSMGCIVRAALIERYKKKEAKECQ